MKMDFTSGLSMTTAASRSKKHVKPTGGGTSQQDSRPSDWLTALATPADLETPGPEWKTRRQICEELGITRWAAQSRLAQGVKMGGIESRKFLIAGASGSRHMVPHYRIVK